MKDGRAQKAVQTVTGPLLGARYVARGFSLIFLPGLRRYTVLPILLNILVFAGVVWGASVCFQPIVNWLADKTLESLRSFFWILFAGVVALLILNTFVLVSTWIGSPFYGFLAQAVERRLRGEELPDLGGWAAILAEVRYALTQELRKFLYYLVSALPFLILFLIPFVNLVAPALFVAYSAWVLAVECVDFPMSNHRVPFVELRRLLRRRMPVTLGFGGALLVLSLIPGLNLLTLPAGVAGATGLWMEVLGGALPGVEPPPPPGPALPSERDAS